MVSILKWFELKEIFEVKDIDFFAPKEKFFFKSGSGSRPSRNFGFPSNEWTQKHEGEPKFSVTFTQNNRNFFRYLELVGNFVIGAIEQLNN